MEGNDQTNITKIISKIDIFLKVNFNFFVFFLFFLFWYFPWSFMHIILNFFNK